MPKKELDIFTYIKEQTYNLHKELKAGKTSTQNVYAETRVLNCLMRVGTILVGLGGDSSEQPKLKP